MEDLKRKETLEIASALEKNGEVDLAVQAFVRAGAIEEAARVLTSARRFAEAGHLLFDALGVAASEVGRLEPARRKVALKAAACLSQAGEITLAVKLLVGLGDRMRAAQVLERSGDRAGAARLRAPEGARGAPEPRAGTAEARARAEKLQAARRLEASGQFEEALAAYLELHRCAEAARLARELGRYAQAAELLLEAELPFEAAMAFEEAGDPTRCLEALVRVPPDQPDYREAAARAIQIAHRLDVLDFQIDQFIAPFLSADPRGLIEEDALYLAGRLFANHELWENARESFERLLRVKPGYRDAADRLAALKVMRKLIAEHGEAAPAPGDDFPDLPPLPEIPVVETVATWPPPLAPTPPPKRMNKEDTVPIGNASSDSAAIRAGVTVAGRYRLEGTVGRGGTATVYRATDLELGESIALKFLTLDDTDPAQIARFKQEVSITRQLGHPNIVRLFDIGEHQGRRFITMELLEGEPLGRLIRGQPMEPRRGLDYLMQACAGLQAAHERGVVHRDVKPDNLLVTHDDRVKIMDFGLAKQSTTPGMTVQGFVAGTPSYMAPEQINGFQTANHLSDLYSLGVTAYEVFTGTLPFVHEELMPLLMMQMNQAPPPPRERNPHIPLALEQVILRLLEKDPTKRVPSCEELRKILGDVLAALGTGS
jgi:serine/threonine-protein kinase